MSLSTIKEIYKFCPFTQSLDVEFSRDEKEVFQLLNKFEHLKDVYFYSMEDNLNISEFIEFLETLRDDNKLTKINFPEFAEASPEFYKLLFQKVNLKKFETVSPLDEETSKIISTWIEKNTILESIQFNC
jgi:hypothetical protein